MTVVVGSKIVTGWFLKGRVDDDGPVRQINLSVSPFQIGRRGDLALCLLRPTISGLHAELYVDHLSLIVRDLDSTNGTYVNGRRVQGDCALKDGDLLQFARTAFRVGRACPSQDHRTIAEAESACDQALLLLQFDKLMSTGAVVPFYQPIVALADRKLLGYEILGRSRLFGLKSPKEMFLAAAQLNVEAELSRMFRRAGIQQGCQFSRAAELFVNTHPAEINDGALIDSLTEIRLAHPSQPITLEVHESTILEVAILRRLKAALHDLQIRLAYDDFGAGQSRLAELSEVRPDYLKFDIQFIRRIHEAPAPQRQMLANLVRMARELGISTVAEGVESAAEHAACLQVGFDLGQGFYYGRPATAEAIHASGRDTQ